MIEYSYEKSPLPQILTASPRRTHHREDLTSFHFATDVLEQVLLLVTAPDHKVHVAKLEHIGGVDTAEVLGQLLFSVVVSRHRVICWMRIFCFGCRVVHFYDKDLDAVCFSFDLKSLLSCSVRRRVSSHSRSAKTS